MYSLSDLKPGRAIVVDNDPFLILSAQFSKQGRQGGVCATKLKNLKTGATVQKTFKGNEKTEEANVSYRHVQFLYEKNNVFTFMDLNDFNQFDLAEELVGEAKQYLKDGMELDVLMFDEQPIAVKLPVTVDLTVKETPPGLKGDTAQGGTKPATLETGLVLQVPLFVNEGDVIRVNTERKEYVERVESG